MEIEHQEKEEWLKIRKKLNQQYVYDANWEYGIGIFRKRLHRKFFNPIQLIIDQNEIKGEGFTIVTVQCSLIEMFAAFKAGKIFNHSKNAASPKYEYKHSLKMFTSLLNENAIFENHFWEVDKNGNKNIDSPFNASDFYKNVRCGLVHEARTKGHWFINAVKLSGKASVKTEKIFLKKDSRGNIKIFRTILHYRLLILFDQYCNDLKAQNAAGEKYRRYFARKMDHLFDIQIDTSYEWWIDR